MTDPLHVLGLICLGMVIAYAVPIGILLFKVRGSTIRLEGLRFVDRQTEPTPYVLNDWRGPPKDPKWIPADAPKEPDYYSQSRDRSGDD